MSIADFFFGRKQNSTASRRSAKLNRNAIRTRTLSMEPLETRDLLSVTTGLIDDSAYAELRAQYPDFNLPAVQSNLNVLTVDCNLADLKSAITKAGSSTKPDLILVKTTDDANTITYSTSSDEITLNIVAATKGSVTIIGWGTKELTLNANNYSRVMTISGSTDAYLGNMIMTKGKHSASTSVDAYGGGVYSTSTGVLTLNHCTISNNNLSTGSAASACGGGIYSTSDLTMTNCNIISNRSMASSWAYGGGIYSTGSLIMNNCYISDNSSPSSYMSSGGGIYSKGASLNNCTITSNSASASGGSTTFSYGGGINSTSDLTLNNCNIFNNSSYSSSYNASGGGVYSQGALTSTNSIISGNSASSSNSGISGNSSYVYGGGIYASTSVELTNCTIANNSVSNSYGTASGGGLYCKSATLYNAIIATNQSSDVASSSGSTINAYNTLSSYTSWSRSSRNNKVYDSSKPLFVSTSDYHLAENSQAINNGNNSYATGQNLTTDLAGIPRIIGGTVDIGAYEFDTRTALSAPEFSVVPNGTFAIVNISPVENASSYRIEYSLNDDFTDSTTIDALEGENSLEGLQKFQTYYLRVKSVGINDYADSDYSTAHSFVTIPTLTGLTLSTDAPLIGTTITTTPVPEDATVEYQWYIGDEPIQGETSSSYTVTADQLGQTIKCVATGTGDYIGTAFAEVVVVVPDGYSEADYQKMVVFLEQTDEDDVKNGTKINANYDPANPLSWTGISWETVDGEDRITSISIQNKSLVGDADFSNLASLTYLNCSTNQLTSLNVSNNTSLTNLLCDSNLLTSLNLSNNILLNEIHCYNNQLSELIACDCIDLQYLYCNSNQLTVLDLSTNTSLINLDCSNNQLVELNLSECDNLYNFSCYSNKLSTLDLTNNVNLTFLSIGDSYLSSVLLVNKVLGKLKVYFYNSRYTVSNSVETITISSSGSYTPTELPFTATSTTTGNTIIFDRCFHLTGLTLSTDEPEVGTVITVELTPADATAAFVWLSGSTPVENATSSSFTVTEEQIGQTISCVAIGTGDYAGTVFATTLAVPGFDLDVPAGLALSSVETTVTAAWSAVKNASAYTVEYQAAGSDAWSTIPDVQGTSASFSGASGTTYNVRVKANGTGNYTDSEYSEIEQITLDEDNKPIIAVNDKKISVLWTDASLAADSVRYRVAGTNKWTVKKLKEGVTEFSFNGALGTRYDIEVLLDQQENNVLQGSATVLDQAKLKADKAFLKDDTFQVSVTNYAAKNLATNSKQAIVIVNGVQTTFNIENQEGSALLNGGGEVAFVNGLFTFTEMNSNTSYKVQISFSDGVSYATLSSALTVKTTKACYLAPAITSATAISDTSITVSWETALGKKSNTPAQKYTVQYSLDGKKWSNATTAATGNSYTIQRLKGGNVYQVRVFATKDNAFEASAPSEVLTAETLTAPKTAIEKNSVKDDSFQVNVTNYQNTNLVKATSITVKSDKFGETVINLENCAGSAAFDNGMTVAFNNGALTFANAPSNTQQKIQVNFSDGVCTTAWSAALTVKTAIAPYNKPNLTSATAVSSTSIQVEWSPVVGKNTELTAQSYTVQYTTDGTRWINANTKVVGTSYTINGLKTGTTYLVAVIANKDARFNASLPSESRQVTTL